MFGFFRGSTLNGSREARLNQRRSDKRTRQRNRNVSATRQPQRVERNIRSGEGLTPPTFLRVDNSLLSLPQRF